MRLSNCSQLTLLWPSLAFLDFDMILASHPFELFPLLTGDVNAVPVFSEAIRHVVDEIGIPIREVAVLKRREELIQVLDLLPALQSCVRIVHEALRPRRCSWRPGSPCG